MSEGVVPATTATADKLNSYPPVQQQRIREIRCLIFQQANSIEACGEVQECLKWGQLSYLTVKPKSGTTIRIDSADADTDDIALYVHCQSRLIDEIREIYPDSLDLRGNRAIVLKSSEPLPVETLKHCLSLALTYHQRKR